MKKRASWRCRARGRAATAGPGLALMQEMESRFSVEAALGATKTTPWIVALVGPPGSGKTELIKIVRNFNWDAKVAPMQPAGALKRHA